MGEARHSGRARDIDNDGGLFGMGNPFSDKAVGLVMRKKKARKKSVSKKIGYIYLRNFGRSFARCVILTVGFGSLGTMIWGFIKEPKFFFAFLGVLVGVVIFIPLLRWLKRKAEWDIWD